MRKRSDDLNREKIVQSRLARRLDLEQRPSLVEREDRRTKSIWLWYGCKIDLLLCVVVGVEEENEVNKP